MTLTATRPQQGEDESPRIFVEIFDQAVNHLAWEEGEIPRLARKILRLRRDGAVDQKIQKQLIEPVFKSIIGSYLKQHDGLKPDPKTGLLHYELTPNRKLLNLLQRERGVSDRKKLKSAISVLKNSPHATQKRFISEIIRSSPANR